MEYAAEEAAVESAVVSDAVSDAVSEGMVIKKIQFQPNAGEYKKMDPINMGSSESESEFEFDNAKTLRHRIHKHLELNRHIDNNELKRKDIDIIEEHLKQAWLERGTYNDISNEQFHELLNSFPALIDPDVGFSWNPAEGFFRPYFIISRPYRQATLMNLPLTHHVINSLTRTDSSILSIRRATARTLKSL